MAFSIFRKNSESAPSGSGAEAQRGSAEGLRPAVAPRPAEDARQELPTTNGLADLVALMDQYHVTTLQLNQQGNEMIAVMDPSEKPERRTVVDTESAWFDAVAKLYTAAQSGPRGPWRRAEVMAATAREGRRGVEVEYTYPDSDRQDREAYVQTVPGQTVTGTGDAVQSSDAAAASVPAAPAAAATATSPRSNASQQTTAQESSAQLSTAQDSSVHESAPQDPVATASETAQERDASLAAIAEDAEQRRAEQNGAERADAATVDAGRRGAEEQEPVRHDAAGTTPTSGASGTPAAQEVAALRTSAPDERADTSSAVSAGTESAAGADAAGERNSVPESDTESAAAPSAAAPSSAGSPVAASSAGLAAGTAAAGTAAAGTSSREPVAGHGTEGRSSAAQDAAGQEAAGHAPVPAVVEDEAWEDGPARAESADLDGALPDSAPSVAEHADVAPSYASPAEPVEKPSASRLALGNLVLTEAEVVQRLRGAQQALFGPQGTARDVSTVLVRVRALGSYYDALTHVRRNGFWDQRATFDLVPEEALQILQLKADSYQEGFGSPIAMMFRFTPGIPPQVSFSYGDEESFVKYPDRLPAQQYVEELRMFPRTGANIPEHMNDALSQWTL